MAKFYFDPSKLNEEQLEQFNELRGICEVSEDDEMQAKVSEYIRCGKYKEDSTLNKGKDL